MLSEEVLMGKAMDLIIDTFGKEYLQKNYKKIIRSDAIIDIDGKNVFQLFLGFKDEEEIKKPNNFKGWTVYAIVRLDTETGETIQTEFETE